MLVPGALAALAREPGDHRRRPQAVDPLALELADEPLAAGGLEAAKPHRRQVRTAASADAHAASVRSR